MNFVCSPQHGGRTLTVEANVLPETAGQTVLRSNGGS
jgi:hypothetical protein